MYLAGASDSSEATIRLFASLSLARLHPDITSWAAPAEVLGVPGPMGVRCGRACSSTMLVTADEWRARIWRAIEETPRENYRALEAKIDHSRGMSRWFDEWARRNRPGTRHSSYDFGLTWQWVHVAHVHLDLSPGWRGKRPQPRTEPATASSKPPWTTGSGAGSPTPSTSERDDECLRLRRPPAANAMALTLDQR